MKSILVMSIGTGLGGIEKSMINFLKFLASFDNCEIDLYLWRNPGALYDQIPSSVNILKEDVSPRGIRECRSLKDYCSYLSFRILDYFSLGSKTLRGLEKEYDIAIAYCQVGHTPYYVIDKVRAKLKYFFYHHGSYQEDAVQKLVDSYYYGAYDGVITMSEANVQMLKNCFPKISNKLHVCAPLFDSEEILTLGRESQMSLDILNQSNSLKAILITVARMSAEKGILNALQAAQILAKNNVDFLWIFVGGGPMSRQYQDFITDNGLEDHCLLIGRLDNPYVLMSKATIYIQPSNIESYCITIREAALFNRPIIASDLPCVREAECEIQNIILTSCDPVNLADSIMKVLLDRPGLKSGKYNTKFLIDANRQAEMKLQQLFDL